MGNSTEIKELTPELKEYRNQLVLSEQKAQENFDKTIVYLCGGALGISFAFVKDIVGGINHTVNSYYLFGSWLCWGLSIACILLSFFVSNMAFRYAIKQVDIGKIYCEETGGFYSTAVTTLNIFGMLGFLLGIILIIKFISINIGG